MRIAAQDIEPGDVVSVPGSRFSLGRGACTQVLTVAKSGPSGSFARDWWRLTFVPDNTDPAGYWVESSPRHHWEVVNYIAPGADAMNPGADDLLGMIL